MKYYEIARFSDQWPEMEEYNEVNKMVSRGWVRKAIDYMSNWDYGSENIATAISLGTLRENVLDTQDDTILKQMNGYYLCKSECPSGLYNAIYLVREIDEQELDN